MLTIIARVSGALVTELTGVAAARSVQRGAAEVAARCRHARELAIAHNRPVRVEFDAERNAHRLTEWRVPEGAQDPDWTATGGDLDDWRGLPPGVRFGRAALKAQRQTPSVAFAPDGSADDFAMLLTDNDARRIAVHIVPLTGAAEILTPDDGEAFAAVERDARELS